MDTVNERQPPAHPHLPVLGGGEAKAQPMNFSSHCPGAELWGFSSSAKKPPLPGKPLFLHPQEGGLLSVCPQAGWGGRDVLRAGLFPTGRGCPVSRPPDVRATMGQLGGLRQ